MKTCPWAMTNMVEIDLGGVEQCGWALGVWLMFVVFLLVGYVFGCFVGRGKGVVGVWSGDGVEQEGGDRLPCIAGKLQRWRRFESRKVRGHSLPCHSAL